MNKRKIEFIRKKCFIVKKAELHALLESPEKKVILRYLLDPLKVEGDSQLVCAVTELQGKPF
jgi:hypothetical protein